MQAELGGGFEGKLETVHGNLVVACRGEACLASYNYWRLIFRW